MWLLTSSPNTNIEPFWGSINSYGTTIKKHLTLILKRGYAIHLNSKLQADNMNDLIPASWDVKVKNIRQSGISYLLVILASPIILSSVSKTIFLFWYYRKSSKWKTKKGEKTQKANSLALPKNLFKLIQPRHMKRLIAHNLITIPKIKHINV